MFENNLPATIEEIAKELRKPAGDSEQFSTSDSIKANREEFVRQCHKTWKAMHQKAVEEILFLDAFLRREKTHPIGPMVEQFGKYQRAIWRRVNDSIIWSLSGLQRHVVKRLCLYRKRTDLSENNASSVMATVADLNKDPLSIALWNDATSCVDIGDVTFIKNGMNPTPGFLELKDGTVNLEIADLLQKEEADFPTAFQTFENVYGKKGVKQFERVVRQKEISEQAMILLREEKGMDPVTGLHTKVLDLKTESTTYDKELNAMIREGMEHKREIIRPIDDCLWVYVAADPSVKLPDLKAKFADRLRKKVSHLADARFGVGRPDWDKDRIVGLNEGFAAPIARPIFLGGLDPDIVGHVVAGDLMFRVFLYLDWEKFGSIFEKAGAQFTWGTDKEVGKARAMTPETRPPIINGRLAKVRVNESVVLPSDPNLVEIFFSSVAPRAIAQLLIEAATSFTPADLHIKA